MGAERASKLPRSGVQWTATPVSSDQIQSLSFEAYEEHDQTQVKPRKKPEACDDDWDVHVVVFSRLRSSARARY
jgi:hypothetical protein